MTDDGSAPTIPTSAALTGPSLHGAPAAPDARYTLRSLLGRGGMGEVWLAHDDRIDRDVAIKMMRGDGGGDPDVVARFLREARVQGRLEHPSVVPVHDLGGAPAAPYFAMKRLIGTTLADLLAARTWARRTLLARFVDVCLAVEFAHQRGVIHRDLKPANIMLGDYGEAYVLDWGLARVVGESEIRTSDLRSDSGSGGQTVAGAMLGTPGYMAPEQMRGETVDARSDVFSLGCVLFEILAGEPAVPREQVFEVTLAAPCHRPAARRSDAEVPPELDDLCARATAADPAARLASARDLADAIQRFLDGDRDLARRRELAVDHAAAAAKLLARGDEGRPEAMREAGRAIALDPSNREAQNLLARLLIEPPRRVPPEARRKIDEERQRTSQAMLRTGVYAYGVFFVFVLAIMLLVDAATWPFLVILGELAALVVISAVTSLRPRYVSRGLFATVVGMHVLLLASIGLFLGPLLLLPILVFGFFPVALTMPSARYPVICLVLHTLAVAVPLGLEWLGVVPHSFEILGGGLVLKPWAIALTPRMLIFVILVTIAGQLVANAVILDGVRRRQERAQEQLHVQAWQLAQLVTTE